MARAAFTFVVPDGARPGDVIQMQVLGILGHVNEAAGRRLVAGEFADLINGRILFSVLDGANKKVRGWTTYGRPAHYVSDP